MQGSPVAQHGGCGGGQSGHPEGAYDFVFRNSPEHKMVVQWAAQQQSPSGSSEPGDLSDDAQGFCGEHDSGDSQQPFLPGLQTQQSQHCAHRKSSGIPHEDLGWISVEPQKSGGRGRQNGRQLPGACRRW